MYAIRSYYGGIGYILEQQYGFNLPAKMRESFGYFIKGVSDEHHKELLPDEIVALFKKEYVNIDSNLKIVEAHYAQMGDIEAKVTVDMGNVTNTFTGMGNGRLDACSNALKQAVDFDFSIVTYHRITSYNVCYTKLLRK